MRVDEAFGLIASAIDSGHAAHGYLIVGDVKGNADELKSRILEKLFPDELDQIHAGCHPDVVTLAPEGKARIITVDAMRERIVEPMSTTAFSGGWKVGVIVGADRMKVEGANAFLKSLEEPTPKTMYLLLTDQPDSILPTIVSRTQRIGLKVPPMLLAEEDREAAYEAFCDKDASALAAQLKALKEEAEDADEALVRKSFYKTLMSFVRTLMTEGKVERYLAFRNIEAVEEAYRRSERSMNDEAVLSYMFDRITLK